MYLAYSTPQRWLPQTSRTCPHTKSTPTLPSDVSDPEVVAKKTKQYGSTVRSVGSSRIARNFDELSLRRGNRWVRCSVVRRGMLTGRKWAGERVAPSVCIERRIVGIVGRVASSQSCGVFVGGKSGKRLGLAPGVSAPKRKVSPFCSRRLTPRPFCHGILFRLFTRDLFYRRAINGLSL